jgi:hypothetical protein
VEALLRGQAGMLGRQEGVAAAGPLRVRVVCPRSKCNSTMAEIRDVSIGPDDRRRAIMFMGLYHQGGAVSGSGRRYASHWVLIESPDVPDVIAAHCHGCSVERVLPLLRLRTALRRARRTHHEQTIHADRVRS